MATHLPCDWRWRFRFGPPTRDFQWFGPRFLKVRDRLRSVCLLEYFTSPKRHSSTGFASGVNGTGKSLLTRFNR